MVKEDYVSLETAKLLKEKGFLKTVDLRMTQNLSFYDKIGLSHNLNKYYDRLIQEKIDFVVAPTLQMAMKWLRDVHKVFVNIDYSHVFERFNYTLFLKDSSIRKYGAHVDFIYNTYEEACESAIKYCLTNLI